MEEKRVNAVTKAAVTKKKGIAKATDAFIQEDWGKIKDYAVNDVIKPGIRDAIWSLATNALDIILYKGTGKRHNASTPAGIIRNYSNMYNNSRSIIRDERTNTYGMKRVYDYGTVEVNSKEEAKAVMFELDDALARYGVARVADLYDAVGYTDVDGQTQKYGWTDLSKASIKPLSNGKWTIILPRPLPIDDGR